MHRFLRELAQRMRARPHCRSPHEKALEHILFDGAAHAARSAQLRKVRLTALGRKPKLELRHYQVAL
jgi:hypothetical protein